MAFYKHYKGGIYRKLLEARSAVVDGQIDVIYLSLKDGEIWSRPKADFEGHVTLTTGSSSSGVFADLKSTRGTLVKRFMEIG